MQRLPVLRSLDLSKSKFAVAFPVARKRKEMSWTCHGSSNEEMVNALRDAKLFQDSRSIEAMKAVDRAWYCKAPERAYIDAPQDIGYNATISAPHMHAACLELLKDHLKPGNKALDVGSGSGYLTTIFAHLLGKTGKTLGIEHIPELADRSREAAVKIPFAAEMLQDGSLRFVTGDGLQGWAEDAPYDAIHVGASAAAIPDPLLEQLAVGGRMVLPVGGVGERQNLFVIERDQSGKLHQQEVMAVQYVPLTSREAQLGKASRLISFWG